MTVAELLNELPFVRQMDVEIQEATEGRATATLTLGDHHTSAPGVAHGGVAYALADTAGGAAVISLHRRPTPTVDMRIDYHEPATTDLRAKAEVVRDGEHLAAADVRVENVAGDHVASARGTFETGGGENGGAWGVTGPDDLR